MEPTGVICKLGLTLRRLILLLVNSVHGDGRTIRTLVLCVYQNMMHYRKLPVGYSERYHTVVSTYRIILCFSYILTENRD